MSLPVIVNRDVNENRSRFGLYRQASTAAAGTLSSQHIAMCLRRPHNERPSSSCLMWLITGDDFTANSLWVTTVGLAPALITRHMVNKFR